MMTGPSFTKTFLGPQDQPELFNLQEFGNSTRHQSLQFKYRVKIQLEIYLRKRAKKILDFILQRGEYALKCPVDVVPGLVEIRKTQLIPNPIYLRHSPSPCLPPGKASSQNTNSRNSDLTILLTHYITT
jgi:hypothetical protein